MSFDLTVSMPRKPEDLRHAWQREFAVLGFDVEVYPAFELATWRGGFLPFRVIKAPNELTGCKLDHPAISGFEIDFAPESAHLRTRMGRPTIEFALQCLGAAILAKLSSGRYFDNQSGLVCDGPAAFIAAEKEIKLYVQAAKSRDLATHPFPGWDVIESTLQLHRSRS